MNIGLININFLILDNDKIISKLSEYISRFDIDIKTYSAQSYEAAKKIIIEQNLDYIFISNDSEVKNKLDVINDLLHDRKKYNCIIILEDRHQPSYEKITKGNIIITEEFSFDLFKRLIGYSIINKDSFIKDNSEVQGIYQGNFIATHDALTMLPNRIYTLSKIEQAIANTKSCDGILMALFFLDLDGFKAINDKAGHKVGDIVLKEAAKRLVNNTRISDIVSRHGGDEFIIFLPQLRHQKDANVVADKILSTLAEPFCINNETWHISASIGVTMYPNDATDAASLIENADAAMYMAKQTGKNTVMYFNAQLGAELAKKHNVINEIREAIANNNFEVDLQPQHDLITGDIMGVELFLRWVHPTKGTIMPEEFLQYILNTGYINSLGDLVVKKALALYYELNGLGINNLNIAINAEARQFINDAFIERIAGLKKLGVNVSVLTIEITEDCFKTNFDSVKQKLLKLKHLGVKICLDNFGVGNSSLVQLVNLPIDIIKIDNKLFKESGESNIVKQGIVSLAHGLGMKVMAKRIENQQQLQQLKDLGCDYGQGYCYEKSLTLSGFINYVGTFKQNNG